jgi:hypothetical protein
MTQHSSTVEEMKDNWMIYEILMQNKNKLNNQIDLLIKEEMKLEQFFGAEKVIIGM